MSAEYKIKDGFVGEKQIHIPREIVIKKLRKQEFLNSLFITQIGYFPKARFHYRERQYGCHDNILIYCVGGKGHYETSRNRYTLNANEFVIIPRAEPHSYQADLREPWSIYWVHFSGNQLKGLNNWVNIEKYKTPTPVTFDNKIIQQWNEMYAVLDNGLTDANLAYANLCLYGFLSNFLFTGTGNVTEIKKENPIGDSIAFMKKNIGKLLTIDQLAKQMGYSTSHYSALFKKQTDISPIEYFIQLKIQYARQLLTQTDYRINEIAGRLGYDDSFYFSRLFKKIMGKSPKDYRNSAGKKSVQATGYNSTG